MRSTLCRLAAPPVIRISNASFYRQYQPSVATDAEALFRGLDFTLPSTTDQNQFWGVIGPSSLVRTAFLNVLRGQYQCMPPTARSYPYLSTDIVAQRDPRLRSPTNAIQYVGFDAERGNNSIRGAYLSARYESRREASDFLLRDFLRGNTELNASEELKHHPAASAFQQVSRDLKLEGLLDLPVSNLSNGQTRRSKIARALLASPEVLLLDGPFMGLDISTVELLSSLLERIAESQSPRIILSLRPDEHLPEWLTHLVYLRDEYKIGQIGARDEVLSSIRDRRRELNSRSAQGLTAEETTFQEFSRHIYDNSLCYPDTGRTWIRKERIIYDRMAASKYKATRLAEKEVEESSRRGPIVASIDGYLQKDEFPSPIGEPIVEMRGVQVAYGDKVALGDWQHEQEGSLRDGLWWTIRRGQRWGVFGPNGSGKTTLTALISSDHPQTYSLPIELFGQSRLAQPGRPGISIFDLQARIGQSSPEVHAFFPKHLSIRRALESAWADTPLSKVRLSFDIDEKVSAALRWFQAELCPDLGPTALQEKEIFRLSLAANARILEAMREVQLEEHRNENTLSWADERAFGSLSFSSQRVVLFLRAIIKSPDLVILDEAFSGMDSLARDKCNLFLSRGESAILSFRQRNSRLKNGPKAVKSDLSRLGLVRIPGLSEQQALVVIAHRADEVPGAVRDWMRLPEPGEGQSPTFGRLDGPLELDLNGWRRIWNQPLLLI